MGFMGLIMACYLGLYGILSGLTKSTDHPCMLCGPDIFSEWSRERLGSKVCGICPFPLKQVGVDKADSRGRGSFEYGFPGP